MGPIPDPPSGVRFCRKCNSFLPLSDFPSGKRRHECKVQSPSQNPSAHTCSCHLEHPFDSNHCPDVHFRNTCGHGAARRGKRCSQTPRGGHCGTSGTMHGSTHNISWASETSASPRQRSEICLTKTVWSQTLPNTELSPGTPARHSLQRMQSQSALLLGRPSWCCGEVLNLMRLCAALQWPRSG